MTVTATTVGYYGYSAAYGFIVPVPATYGIPVYVSGNTAGDWLVAVISIQQAVTSWTATTSASGSTTTFVVSTAAAAPIYTEDQFTGPVNAYGSYLYYVTNVSLPSSSGNVTVTFTPPAAAAIGSGVTLTETGCTASVADDAHNWWYPVGSTACTSSAAGITRTMIWAAPAARACDWVVATPTAGYQAMTLVVYDVSGLSPYATVLSNTTGYANTTESISGSLGAPGQEAFVITATGSDNLAHAISLGSGEGWGTVFQLTEDNGVNHDADINSSSAWQVTSSSTTANWSSTGNVDFSLAMAAISVAGTAPAQPNPNWPYVITELALGAGPGVPQDQLTWTPLTQPASTRTRVLSANLSQGKQYMLDQLQSGQGTVVLDDPDQLLIPPGSGAFTGIDSGVPVRMRMVWPGGVWDLEFSGDGSTAHPSALTGPILPVSAGGTYTASAYLACSIPDTAGVYLLIAWYDSLGNYLSASTASATVTAVTATFAVTSGVAPQNGSAGVIIQAGGTPASTTVFYATAAYPQPVLP